MSGIDFIADTNAIIYLLSGKPYMKQYEDARLGVSVITEMELLSFPRVTPTELLKKLLKTCPAENLVKQPDIQITPTDILSRQRAPISMSKISFKISPRRIRRIKLNYRRCDYNCFHQIHYNIKTLSTVIQFILFKMLMFEEVQKGM